MKKIEFGELQLGHTARSNLKACISSEWVSSGRRVLEFEKKWGKLFNYHHSKAVSSGTDAVTNLVASLYEFGAKRGDEVIVPALSFIATANAVLAAGFTPVFVDVERETMNINPDKIEAAITNKTRAILAVHTMGRPCDMDKINSIAKEHDLKVFEDACEAHGAKYKGRYVGKLSDGAAFSFYVAHLVSCGEGGMVSTDNKVVAESVHSTRTHGRRDGEVYFEFDRIGFNSKMNDMQASIGIEGVEKFSTTYVIRRNHLFYLLQFVKKENNAQDHAYFIEEDISDDYEHCPHAFSVILKEPNDDNFKRLCQILDDRSIAWKRNFGSIPTQHKAYSYMGHKQGEFPEAEYVGKYGLHVGVHQHLSADDIEQIKIAFVDFFGELDESS